MKKLLLAALLAGSFGSVALPASAQVFADRAPPPPRQEVVPAPRHGYVWAPGHWEWRRGNHVWVRGSWMRERHGYAYTAPTWVERGGHWEMDRGGWHRHDRDGDGVPDHRDARPNNPNRS